MNYDITLFLYVHHTFSVDSLAIFAVRHVIISCGRFLFILFSRSPLLPMYKNRDLCLLSILLALHQLMTLHHLVLPVKLFTGCFVYLVYYTLFTSLVQCQRSDLSFLTL